MTFRSNRNSDNSPMTNEQLQKFAPSAFAGQAHESRSDRYAFIPTSDVIDGMRQHGFLPVSAIQSTSRILGKSLFTKHQIRFCAPDSKIVSVGDTSVEISMTNSHDGTSAYELSLGAFRLVCSNGMMVADGVGQIIKVRHTGNIIAQVIEATEALIEQAPKVVNAITAWKQIQMSDQEQLLLAEHSLNLRFDESPIKPESILTSRRSADINNDLWSVFNRIQEHLIRGGIRYRTPAQYADENGNQTYVPARRNRTRQVTGIDQNTRLNRELWSLAEKFAELKA